MTNVGPLNDPLLDLLAEAARLRDHHGMSASAST